MTLSGAGLGKGKTHLPGGKWAHVSSVPVQSIALASIGSG